MNCGEVIELIQLYLDDELDARDTLSVQSHVESCSACSRILSSFLEQDRLLREEARTEKVESDAVRQRILRTISDSSRRSRLPLDALAVWSSRVRWKRAAVIAGLATFAGLLSLRVALLPGLNPNVYAAVVTDHADHCSNEPGMGAITSPGELDRLSEAYGKLDRTPDLSAFGYGNPSGRTCKVSGTLFLHLVYSSPGQHPLSVFLRPHSSGLASGGIMVLREAGYVVTSVSKSGIDLLVVTPPDYDRGSAIAQAILSQL